MSLYADLGLQPDASEAEIKAAWHTYAREHHPDRGGDEAAFKPLLAARPAPSAF